MSDGTVPWRPIQFTPALHFQRSSWRCSNLAATWGAVAEVLKHREHFCTVCHLTLAGAEKHCRVLNKRDVAALDAARRDK